MGLEREGRTRHSGRGKPICKDLEVGKKRKEDMSGVAEAYGIGESIVEMKPGLRQLREDHFGYNENFMIQSLNKGVI